jgi:hypothetical protein
MKVRKQTPGGGNDVNGRDNDMVWGHGIQDFWVDVPDAVALACVTRLRLQYGEWFLNTVEGTPWATRVLGNYTDNTRDITMQTRILGTRGCKEILQYSSSLDRETRRYKVDASIDTIYGKAIVQGPI